MKEYMTLNIVCCNEATERLYSNHETFHEGDSGIDLFFPECVVVKKGETKLVPLGIKAAVFDKNGVNSSFLLMPRSSIVKTPLRLANSIGLIDAGYRGELMVALDNIKNEDFVINAGTRLVQAVCFNGKPFHFKVVKELNNTSRGQAGFGSTNALTVTN
ncbi:deoxyuridine 5'-triphosphate nucleotidohydrolase-like [Hylaeus volcanicus]|uniref:deoxyuridine 5'-triphosphate nucleotidohydrolase-like n=1 Tax=Hylaeus volcanicus TaxID=313075 RepID=UPI0023B83086|nr:deoxyuridine 5'-triphosphate nucleotidohydrolase-like [Hylaeus volcanicus]